MLLREPLIDYLKAHAEGRPVDLPWDDWWREHAQELKEQLGFGWYYTLHSRGARAASWVLHRLEVPYQSPPAEYEPDVVPRSWLQVRMTVEQVEQDYQQLEEFLRRDGVEYSIPAAWYELKERMQEGDEIWYFFSPGKTWATRMGRAGYTIVRDGKPVDAVNVLKN